MAYTIGVNIKQTVIEPSEGAKIVGVRSIMTEIVDGQLEITVSIEESKNNSNADNKDN